MTPLAEHTIEVMPLGRRGRYSMTPRLQRAYIALVKMTDIGDRAPAFHEIGGALGCAKSNVAHLVDGLEERGWIKREHSIHRGITLTEPVLRNLLPVTR